MTIVLTATFGQSNTNVYVESNKIQEAKYLSIITKAMGICSDQPEKLRRIQRAGSALAAELQKIEEELGPMYSVGTSADVSNMPMVSLLVKQAVDQFTEEITLTGCLG